MVARQYATKQTIHHWRNQTGNLKKSRNNENESTIVQNVWDAAKTILRGTFITVQSYIKKKEKSQVNNLTLHVKQLEKEEPMKRKISRRKKIINIRGEINEIKTKKQLQRLMKLKASSLKR